MVPRLKTRAVTKPAKPHREPNVGNLSTIANAANSNQSLSSKTARRRGRPITMSKMVKPGQRMKRPPNQVTDSPPHHVLTEGGNADAQNVTKKNGHTQSDREEEALGLERQRPRTRGRPKGTSTSNDGVDSLALSDDVISSGSAPQLDVLPESQISQPMLMGDAGPQKPNNATTMRMGGSDGRPVNESATDNMDVISLRGQFDDLSRRYESLQARHRDLWDIGVKAAELNFQNLKKETNDNIKASKQVILHLQEELSAQSQIVDQVDLLRKQLEQSQAEADDLRATLAKANNALSESKSEIKAMQVKLAASRANEVNAKTANTTSKPIAPGNRAHQEILQNTQAKEDLYCDLTGLIVRDVKRGKKEDIYDCIQTGRNGSLHFKLALEKVEGNDYEDVQFTYRPQLDEKRDREVIEMLPDYLTEEITFPRPHSSKFYARVIKALTERVE